MASSLRHSRKFVSQIKKLARKYPSVVGEVDAMSERLKQGERPGIIYKRLDRKVFRERLPNRSARRGKSGGFRVSYLDNEDKSVVLLSICARNDCRDLEEDAIRRLLIVEGL